MRRAFAAVVALLFVACGRPPLDQGGSIRCGTDGDGGVCPPDFECRWDHCCPANSSTRTCPAPGTIFAADPSGHAYVPINGVCPAGYEVRFDQYCCPTGSGPDCPTRIIGSHCATDSQCDAPPGLTAFCLTNQFEDRLGQQFPGGYCVAEGCDPAVEGSCGANAVCSGFMGPGTGVCLRSCRLATGAIAGPCDGTSGSQLCVTRSDPGDLTLGVCVPDCSRAENADQCDALHGIACLEVFSGLHTCVLPCGSMGQCPTGSTCTGDGGYCRAN